MIKALSRIISGKLVQPVKVHFTSVFEKGFKHILERK